MFNEPCTVILLHVLIYICILPEQELDKTVNISHQSDIEQDIEHGSTY